MEEIKPCPVCGSTDVRYYEEGLARRDENNFWFVEETVSECLECNNCGHVAEGRTYHNLIKNWNEEELPGWEKAIKEKYDKKRANL